MKLEQILCTFAILLTAAIATADEPISIRIDPAKRLSAVSRNLTGICIEDVNHEIYGGLYSQMIFGESFAEPADHPVDGFTAFGGDWAVHDGVLDAGASDGATLIKIGSATLPGDFGVDLFLPGVGDGNAGVVFNVTRPGTGADRFNGYEVSVDAAARIVRIARHHQDYKLIRDVPADIGTDRWITLSIHRQDKAVEIFVDGKSVTRYEADDIIGGGEIGLRTWHRPARFRNLRVSNGNDKTTLPLVGSTDVTSRMWSTYHRGDAAGSTAIVTTLPFVGEQSQRLIFRSGSGEFGIENRGLNRQGLGLIAGRPYQGHLWAKSRKPAQVVVALSSADGSHNYAVADPAVTDGDWHRCDFALTPDTTDAAGRFQIGLNSPGEIEIGYVFLEPGPWGLFHGLPARGDVARAIVEQGVTAIRYGGSMVNNDHYRWKNMIGDRDRRPPYRGLWYPYSSNGWGIADFLNLCDVAHILPVPDFNIDETPADMMDFLEYANGPADSPWGARRAADGHPAPYGLTHIELGNEERVDETYNRKFEAIARAVWAKDSKMILTVGDFTYKKPIADPFHFDGADSGIHTMTAHQSIFKLAKQFDAEVWFDIHVWTDQPTLVDKPNPFLSYVDAIDSIASGAKHHVVIFELNANNHQQRRALANAQAILRIERDGRIPFVSSANGLQVDRQNDNGWDQGLIFLNPEKVWMQPPGYAWQMLSSSYQPTLVDCQAAGGLLETAATVSDDGKTVVLQAVNAGDQPVTANIEIAGWTASDCVVTLRELSAPLRAANPAGNPETATSSSAMSRGSFDGRRVFPPRSITTFSLSKW